MEKAGGVEGAASESPAGLFAAQGQAPHGRWWSWMGGVGVVEGIGGIVGVGVCSPQGGVGCGVAVAGGGVGVGVRSS